MKNIAYLGGLLLAWSCISHAATLTPAEISSEIELHGAKAVVQKLYSAGLFDQVLDDIAAGQSAWIQLAPGLARGTDAGTSEGLIIALAHALPNNPKAVLEVLDTGSVISAHAVCGVPFIEPTPQEIAAYLERAIPAVEAVQESTQFPMREDCLQVLLQIKSSIVLHSADSV
jgi:hypothetical protein